MRDRRESVVVGRTVAETIMNQPEPMVGNLLDFVEIVPLISDLPVLDEQLIDIFLVSEFVQNHTHFHFEF